MANQIKPKSRSADATAPTLANLADGEIAVNSFAKRIYQRVGTNIIAVANYFSGAWADISGKPNTLAGYGIGDAQPLDGTLTALAGLTAVANRIPYFTGADTAGLLTLSTDGTLSSNSDTFISSQKAIKTYIDGRIAAADAMVFKGVIDCSANPNYPAADTGWTYRVSVAGKIGGASGPNVEAGDILICITDGTAAGTHAAVGAQWGVIQTNIDGAITTAAIGSTVQGYDATLAALAGVTTAANKGIYATGADTFATYDLSAAGRALANALGTANTFPYFSSANTITPATLTAAGRALLDDADAAAQRVTLQLGTAAVAAATDFATAAHGHDYSELTGTVPTWNQSTTGNAATATKLATARTINGVAFDGTANITITAAVDLKYSTNAVADLPSAYPLNPTIGQVNSGTGWPGGSLGTIFSAVTDSAGNRVFQLFSPNKGGTETPELYVRSHHSTGGGGGWTAFKRVWNEGNFDPASKADVATTVAGYGITDAYPLQADLGGSVDLNAVTTTGIYHQPLNANAASGSNYPVATAGMLHVYASSVMVYQTYQQYSNGARWHRSSYNGTWSAWRATWDSANLASPMTTNTAQSVSGAKTFTSNVLIDTGTLSDLQLGSTAFGMFGDATGARTVIYANAGYVAMRPNGRGSVTAEFKVDGSGFTWGGNTGWHAGNFDPTTKLDTSTLAATATANSTVQRDASADISARLFKASFADQATISGAIAFRINNSTDSFLRYCSDKPAIRSFLGLGSASLNASTDFAAASHTHTMAQITDLPTVSVTASSGTVVQRHASGYIYANFFNTTASFVGATAPTAVMVETSSDGFIRKQTPADYKRMTMGIQNVTSAATVTPSTDNDIVAITAQAAALAIANPTGSTPVQGQGIVIRIKDNGTSRAISWGTAYRAIGATLPTATTASKTMYVGLIYNATDAKWDVVSVAKEA